jgi:hypothetical protein
MISQTKIDKLEIGDIKRVNATIKIPNETATGTYRIVIKATAGSAVAVGTMSIYVSKPSVVKEHTNYTCFDWSDCVNGTQERICQSCVNGNCTNTTETRKCQVVVSSITGAIVSTATSPLGIAAIVAALIAAAAYIKRKSIAKLFKKEKKGGMSFDVKYESGGAKVSQGTSKK